MTDNRDTEVLQVFRCEVRKNRLVYLVFAESRLIPSEAKAPQPDHNVHDGDPNSRLPHIIVLPGEGVQDSLVHCAENWGVTAAHTRAPRSTCPWTYLGTLMGRACGNLVDAVARKTPSVTRLTAILPLILQA